MHDHSSLPSAFPAMRIVVVVAIYMMLWTLLPPLLSHSVALDVAESLSWGKEFQWGYYKHPPLAPIVLNAFYEVFGKFGPYLLSQLCIALTLWMVWCTGLRLMDPARALIGAVLTMGVSYYAFPAIEFNHNIAQMPLWAAIGYCFVVAVQDGRWWQWVMLGVLAGLGLLTKYSIAVLLLALGLYLLVNPSQRRWLLRPQPWLAVGLMILVFLPHVWWLKETDGLPFSYASGRALASGGSPRLAALEFPVTQGVAHLPLLLVLSIACWRTRGSKGSHTEDAKDVRGRGSLMAKMGRLHTNSPALLLVLALLPCAIVTLLGVILGVRLRDMWGSPMWAFSGLLVVACISEQRFKKMQPKLLAGIGVWLLLVTAFMVIYMGWGAQLRKKAARVDWPAHAIAEQAQQTWGKYAGACPLDIVVGDYWLAGLLSAYVAERPSVLIHGDPRFSPWVDAQRIERHGALWMWQAPSDRDAIPQPPLALEQASHSASLHQHVGVWEIMWPYAPHGAPLRLQWRAYVPSSCEEGKHVLLGLEK